MLNELLGKAKEDRLVVQEVVSSPLVSFVQVGRTTACLKGQVSVIGGRRPVPR